MGLITTVLEVVDNPIFFKKRNFIVAYKHESKMEMIWL